MAVLGAGGEDIWGVGGQFSPQHHHNDESLRARAHSHARARTRTARGDMLDTIEGRRRRAAPGYMLAAWRRCVCGQVASCLMFYVFYVFVTALYYNYILLRFKIPVTLAVL